MNTQKNPPTLTIQDIQTEIENYVTTIQVLQSFISVVTWEDGNLAPGSEASLGRRMETSANNAVSPVTTVTPDAVIQRNGNLGYLVEAKKSLPADQSAWRNVLDQLRKYDDNLSGWWTSNEEIDLSCTVLLLEISRVADFRKYIEIEIDKNGITFTYPLSLVEFTRSPEVKEFLFLRKYWGTIENQFVSDKLDSGIKVPIENVVATYGEKRFYDATPVTEFTMVVLWQDVFTNMKTDVEHDDNLGAFPLEVNTTNLTSELQQLYGSTGNENRDVAFPKKAWIRAALEGFVTLRLAKRLDDDNYVILFKRLKTDLVERFSKHRKHSRDNSTEKERQLNLFDNGESGK